MSGKRYPIVPTGNGTEVVQTGPDACPNGHPFGPNRVMCSWLPCLCAPPEVGHSTWKCMTCGVVIYDPPHDVSGPPTVGSLYDASPTSSSP